MKTQDGKSSNDAELVQEFGIDRMINKPITNTMIENILLQYVVFSEASFPDSSNPATKQSQRAIIEPE